MAVVGAVVVIEVVGGVVVGASGSFGGLDVQLAGLLGFGAELQHRRLPNALGNAGASAAFREDDLGGLTIRLWIGIGR